MVETLDSKGHSATQYYLTPHTSHSLAIISTQLSNPATRNSFYSPPDMAHQFQSARLQALFEPALQAFEKKAGVSLTQHPLAIKLQNCDSVDAITGLFQDQARAFMDLQRSDKIMKSIKTTVSILSKLSSAASLADAFGLVCQRELVTCFTSDCFLTGIPTRESDTSLSRHPT